MRAVVLTKFGPPEVLQLREVAQPIPKANEVLVKIQATSVFAGDCEIRGLKVGAALKLPIWLYLRFGRPQPVILGQEFAGEIEAVGQAVRRFKPGDQVLAASGFGLGAYAEYVCLPAEAGGLGGALALKPANLTYAEAATIPVGGLEALHFIRLARLQRGERVLINGAGGSIGVMAIQLAKNHGAEVTAVDSAEKLAVLRAIGADHVLDYARDDFTQRGQAYDVILDVVGRSPFARSLKTLTPNGRYLLANPGLAQQLRARLTATGSKQVIQGSARQTAADLEQLKALLEAGHLKPVIDRTYPLEQLAAAHRYVDAGHKKGTVAVTVGPTS